MNRRRAAAAGSDFGRGQRADVATTIESPAMKGECNGKQGNVVQVRGSCGDGPGGTVDQWLLHHRMGAVAGRPGAFRYRQIGLLGASEVGLAGQERSSRPHGEYVDELERCREEDRSKCDVDGKYNRVKLPKIESYIIDVNERSRDSQDSDCMRGSGWKTVTRWSW